MFDKARVKQVFSLLERVRKEAKELAKLPDATLAAVLGGSAVIGVVGGGLFWIPAAMAGGIFVYRSTITALEYSRYRKKQRIQEISDVREELENIDRTQLPIEYKEQLSRAAIRQILPSPGSGYEHRALEHKKDKDVT